MIHSPARYNPDIYKRLIGEKGRKRKKKGEDKGKRRKAGD
jgi:hypothetical protein